MRQVGASRRSPRRPRPADDGRQGAHGGTRLATWPSRRSARSSMSTWTPSTRRWSSAIARAARQAGGGRRAPARRGRGGELRGAHLRRALGHAVGDGPAAVRRAGVREAALRRLQGGVAPDPRDLRSTTRRSSNRCRSTRPISTSPTNLKGMPLASEIAARDPRPHLRAHRPHRLGRHLLQQVPGQARLGPSQAQRPDR